MATCPECDADIEVDEFDVDKGDQLSCPDCGSNLEVIGLSPIELDLAPEDEDDDDDDERKTTISTTTTTRTTSTRTKTTRTGVWTNDREGACARRHALVARLRRRRL